MAASLKLGLLPRTEDPNDLRLSAYLRPAVAPLPTPPEQFGHEDKVSEWGMLGNDEWGDCAWAGPAHESMLLNAAAGRQVAYSTEDVLADYGAATGFDPAAGPSGANPTDRGSDLRAVAGYRRRIGILDAADGRHQIGAYIWLDPGDLDELKTALYIFGTVGIGIDFPDTAMAQFNAGEDWDVVDGAKTEGGHYVCVVGWRDTIQVVTWGKCIGMTPAFYTKYATQALAYVSRDQLLDDEKTPEGFDNQQLLADLEALGVAGIPAPAPAPANP